MRIAIALRSPRLATPPVRACSHSVASPC